VPSKPLFVPLIHANQADPSDYALRQRSEADFQNLLFAALTSGR
jgi:hypothetical protein